MAEGGVLPPVVLELRAKATEVFSELGKVKHELSEMDKSAQKAGKSSASALDKTAAVGKTLAIGLGGAAIAVGGFALEAATSAEVVDAKLRVAVENAGGSMEEFDPKVAKLDDSMRKLGFTNDQVNTALATSTTALKDPEKALGIMGVAADLARAKNIDLNTATLLVSKAMEGQTRPLKALGIDLPIAAGNALAVKKAQDQLNVATEKAKTFLAAHGDAVNKNSKYHLTYEQMLDKVKAAQGRLSDAQHAGGDIMKELAQRVDGAAGAYGDTLKGKMDAARAGIENMGEKLGKLLIPLITKAIGAATDFAGYLDSHRGVFIAIASLIGGLMTIAIGTFIAKWTAAKVTQVKDMVEMVGKAGVWVATRTAQLLGLGTAAEASSATQVAANDAVMVSEEEAAVVAEEAGAAQALAFGPIGLAIIALIAVVIFLVTHWKQAWGVIKSVFEACWSFLKTAWTWIKTAFLDVLKVEIAIVAKIWSVYWGVIKAVFGAVWDFLKTAWSWISGQFMAGIKQGISIVHSVWSAAWGGIKSVVSGAWSIISGIWNGLKTGISAVGDAIKGFGGVWKSIWDGIGTALKWVYDHTIGPIVGTIKGAISGISSAINGVSNTASAVGNFLGFDNGGVVPGAKGAPRLAVVHGGEYVLSNDMLAGRQAPTGLNKAQSANGYTPALDMSAAALSGSAPAGTLGNSVTVNVSTNASPRAIASAAGWELRRMAS